MLTNLCRIVYNCLKKYADYIYLIENGRVSHYGTHEEMMEGENMYADYWRAFM